MTPDQLRDLADALEPMAAAPRFDGLPVAEFCAWLRQCAEQRPAREWAVIDAAIREYLTDYEMLGETDTGADAYYTPTERERDLIYDAINGLLGDEQFMRLIAAAPVPPQDFNVWKQIIPEDAPQAEPSQLAGQEISLGALMREQRQSRIVAGAYPDGNPNAGAMMAQTPQAETKREPSEKQIADACLRYRHDFGLLDKYERDCIVNEARRWADAFRIGGSDERR